MVEDVVVAQRAAREQLAACGEPGREPHAVGRNELGDRSGLVGRERQAR